MYINTLNLLNCKLFKDLTIDFEHGLNLIQGPNSVGKSSILKIIQWILWGSKRGVENILRRGEKELYAELIYINNNKQYKIVKTYNLDKDNLNFEFHEKNGTWTKLLDSKTGSKQYQLKNKIELTTEIRESLFESLLYFEQKKYYNIIYGGWDVKSFLDFVLNITQLIHLQNIVKEIEKDFEENIENEDIIRQQIKDTQHNLEVISQDVKDYKKKIQKYTEQIKKITADNKSIQDLYNILTEVNDPLEESYHIFKNLINHEQRLAEIDNTVEAKIKNDNTIRKNLKVKLKCRRELANIRHKISQLQIKKQEIVSEISSITTKIKNSKKIISNIESFKDENKGICPTCQQIVSKEHIIKEVKKHQEKIDEWNKTLSDLSNNNIDIDSELNTLSNKTNELDSEKYKAIQNINTFIELSMSKYIELTKYKDSRDQIYYQLDILMNKYHELIKQYNLTVNPEEQLSFPLEAKVEKVVKNPIYTEINDLAKLEVYTTTYNNIQTKVNSLYHSYQSKIQEKQNTVAEYIKEKDKLENRINLYSDSIKKLNKKLENIKIIRENQKIYSFIQEVFDKITKKIRDIKIQNLEKQTYEWYKQLVSIPQFKAINIDPENYSVSIYPNDSPEKQFVELSDNLSGGNETLLAIAERLALIKNVSNPIILLDETTDGADSNNIASEVEGLSAISNLFPQIILITHHKIGSQYANKVIKLTKDEKTNITSISSIT